MSNPSTDPLAPIVTALNAEALAAIAKYANGLPAAWQPLVSTYAGALITMATAQGAANIEAYVKSVFGMISSGNLDALHEAMTNDQLAAEEVQQSQLFRQMADDSYAAQQLTRSILSSAATIAIGVLASAIKF